MAKWGEGDPRWLVEEREDGTNADNWHWTEKNATKWSHSTITDLLVGLAVDDANGKARVTEVDSIEGDVIANMRKGKLIFFYEVEIKLKWKGESKDGQKINGSIFIPNLSEENDADDLDFQVKASSEETPEKKKVKELMRKPGVAKCRAMLAKWIVMLKEEYAKDLVKPSKKGAGDNKTSTSTSEGVKAPPTSKPTSSTTAAKKTSTSSATSGADKPTKKKSGFVTIKLDDEFKCRATDLFQALCTPEKVRAYTQSDCKIDPKVGGEFSLFSGNVTGVFEELTPHSVIKQAWRFKHWPAGHFSKVTLTITEKGDKCKLELVQSNVPSDDAESTKAGWRSHQWDRMKQILGFGSNSGLNFAF